MVDGNFTGDVEEAWIMAQLTPLCGGKVWETQVPDNVSLPRDSSGRLTSPYLIVRFANPFASSQGRNIATDEQGQPHIMTFTVLAVGGDAASVKTTIREVNRRLVGKLASDTASPIKASGGFSYAQSEAGSRPTRFERAGFYRMPINR